MAKVKEGDRVRVVERAVTEQDRKTSTYFDHMKGLTGTVANVYGPDEVAVKVDLDALQRVPREVHDQATAKMREKFLANAPEEARKSLTKEELEFVPHSVVLVRSADLERI
jgi:hypothetical protein